MRRRIHEIEVHQVVDAHRLEGEHHVAQVRALDLRDGTIVELVAVTPECEQPKAYAGSDSTSPTSPLVGVSLRTCDNLQALHSSTRIECSLFAETAVNNIHYIINGNGCLGNVGCNDNLATPFRRGFKYLDLLLAGQ
jgi:hypothetical protein